MYTCIVQEVKTNSIKKLLFTNYTNPRYVFEKQEVDHITENVSH